MAAVLPILAVLAACAGSSLAYPTYRSDIGPDICYNHQTRIYDARFKPTYCRSTCSVTPFFSPDHSIDTYVKLIESATSSIDIYTPGLDSWSECTSYKKECSGECIGCTLPDQKAEAFPVFPALLNAIHERNIKVRLLTNNFTQPTCPGKIAPLDWFYQNGMEVRFYTTTTFMHSKFIIIDHGKKTAVSSVNFSKTSFTKNREAGVILNDCSCSAVTFYSSVYEYDWDNATPYIADQTYSTSNLSYITDSAHMDVNIPPPPHFPGAFVTSVDTYDDVTISRAYTGPDYARDTFFSYLQNVQSSLQVMIYQITDDDICSQMLTLHQSGVNVSLIVSHYIDSYEDYKKAWACYEKLYNGGLQGKIRKSYADFTFTHAKFWIIDGKAVHLSTGNWSPSDFPPGSEYPSEAYGNSINRDLLIVMESSQIVSGFEAVFNGDWAAGQEWHPKTS